MRVQFGFLWSLAIAFAPPLAATATPLAELSLGPDALQNQEIAADGVRLVVESYTPIDFSAPASTALSYAIYINDELQTQVQKPVDFTHGQFTLENLDPDGVPEVVFHRYTGGAHCCIIYTLYSWQGDRLHRILTYPLDASADGSFEDLDNDGYSEFLTSDNRFLYAFGSYASSWPPSITLSFRSGFLVDVTQQFPERMYSDLERVSDYLENANPEMPETGINGFLAGYVAHKILLGEYESGWKNMLNHFDPTDDWGLTQRNRAGEVVETYADYPTALATFLTDLGYLDANGEPNPHLDLSKAIVEQESLL